MTIASQYARLLKDCSTQLPGAMQNAIKHEFFGIIDEFCRTTSVWKEEYPINVKAGKKDYYFALAEGKMIRLHNLVDQTGATVNATLPLHNTLRLAELPSTNFKLTATVVVTVADPLRADGFPNMPEWLVYQHGDAIKHGVIGIMMLQPQKPYSNANTGTYHVRKYRNLMAEVRASQEAGGITGGQNWQFPSFA